MLPVDGGIKVNLLLCSKFALKLTCLENNMDCACRFPTRNASCLALKEKLNCLRKSRLVITEYTCNKNIPTCLQCYIECTLSKSLHFVLG